MTRILGFSLVALMAFGSAGCAAQAQCLRDNEALQIQHDQDQRALRDAHAQVASTAGEHATADLAGLAHDSWEAVKAAASWSKVEVPIASHHINETYLQARVRLQRVQECYRDHGGGEDHTYEEYKAMIVDCLNSK